MDLLNKKTMSKAIQHYEWKNTLTAPELSALDLVPDIKDQPILDIGIGTGRTTHALTKLSNKYIGIDYAPEMVKHCRKKFPHVCLEQADARDLSMYKDKSFHTIFFSMNGLCMVDHEGRMAILKEVSRLLKPEGAFLFSTYNRESIQYRKAFQFPKFDYTLHPAKFLVRSARFSWCVYQRAFNRFCYKRAEVHHPEYTIVNDVCHDYGTMLYYCTHPTVKKQLRECGFKGDLHYFDLNGRKVTNHDSTDDSLFYVVRKIR